MDSGGRITGFVHYVLCGAHFCRRSLTFFPSCQNQLSEGNVDDNFRDVFEHRCSAGDSFVRYSLCTEFNDCFIDF